MKRSDINHLRRLLGWVSCEIGQSPDEMVVAVKNMLPRIGDIDNDAKQRLVEWHDKARNVPAYVRDAVKALRKTAGAQCEIVDAELPQRKITSKAPQ